MGGYFVVFARGIKNVPEVWEIAASLECGRLASKELRFVVIVVEKGFFFQNVAKVFVFCQTFPNFKSFFLFEKLFHFLVSICFVERQSLSVEKKSIFFCNTLTHVRNVQKIL